MINGNDDATINDDSTLRYYIAQEGQGNLKVVGDLLTGDDYGIAVPKGNPDTLNAMDAAIKQLVDDGTYDQIYQKWLEKNPNYARVTSNCLSGDLQVKSFETLFI